MEKILGKLQLNPNSKTYKDLKAYREYMGLYVTRSGQVFRKNGTLVKPIIRYRPNSKIPSNLAIKFRYKGKQYFKSYQRFIYSAWNQSTFNIDNLEIFVESKDGNPFDTYVPNLIEIPREEHVSRLHKRSTKFTQDDREAIADMWERYNGTISTKQFIEIVGISRTTLNKILKETKSEQ